MNAENDACSLIMCFTKVEKNAWKLFPRRVHSYYDDCLPFPPPTEMWDLHLLQEKERKLADLMGFQSERDNNKFVSITMAPRNTPCGLSMCLPVWENPDEEEPCDFQGELSQFSILYDQDDQDDDDDDDCLTYCRIPPKYFSVREEDSDEQD